MTEPSVPNLASMVALANSLSQYWVSIDFQQIAALEKDNFYNPLEQSLQWQIIMQEAIEDL